MRSSESRGRAGGHLIAALILPLLVSACAQEAADGLGSGKGMACVDDSQTCVAERSIALNALLNDKQRVWIREPARPEAYASGVRLFAYKQRKRELSCDELVIGRKEAEAGPATLRGPQGKGLSPAQISRGVMFAEEVSRELAGEMKRRCRA